MKIKIRKNVFETNSSSVHSIVVSKLAVPKENVTGSIHFGLDQFGWEGAIYSKPQDKANYLYTAIMDYYGNGSYDAEDYVDYIKEVLEKYGIEATFEDAYNPDGWNYYIDHVSGCRDFLINLRASEDKLISYLFSDMSYVNTGNDNGSDYPSEPDDLSNIDYFRKGN